MNSQARRVLLVAIGLLAGLLISAAIGPVALAAAQSSLPLSAASSPPPEHRADPSLQTYVVRKGPFQISPYGLIKRSDVVKPPPVAGSIVAMDARIVDGQGRVVPQHIVMMHHFLMTNGGVDNMRRDGACPQRPVRERFYGTSEELRAMTFPRGYGYPSDPRDQWEMIWMVMNHRAFRHRIYVEYRVTVDPRPQTPVKPYWLSVVPCVSDQQFTVPGTGEPLHTRVASMTLPAGGRIVAIGGHMHGGGLGLTVSQPRCGGRPLATSQPMYAAADDPLYGVKPLLHEPDPKNMSWWQSARGWPVAAGEPLNVTSIYDGTRPHMRVMGIAHVYVAADPAAPSGCAPAPPDGQRLGAEFGGGRLLPPAVRLTLARRGRDGRAREISRPRGKMVVKTGGANVAVRRYKFLPANLSIAAGGVVRWSFKDRAQHDVTTVTAPLGFAAPYSRRGASYWQRFTVPGEYRLYCSLHPAVMSQYVRVRAPGR